MERKSDRPRLVNARRVSTLAGLAALATAGVITTAQAEGEGEAAKAEESAATVQVEAEGEAAPKAAENDASAGGESEGARSPDTDVAFLSGLAFMEGHIRAGLALYEQGDLAAAKTHMGHPIEEKYDAVAERLEDDGHADLRDQVAALAAAVEAEADLAEVQSLYDAVHETLEEAREDYPVAQQVAGLVDLTRIAGAEYADAVEDGSVSNLHEYQDSWGFLREVEYQARELAENRDADIAAVGQAILDQVDVTAEAFGDLQGAGEFEVDPSILYAAAARMELARLTLTAGDGDAEAGDSQPEGEGEGD